MNPFFRPLIVAVAILFSSSTDCRAQDSPRVSWSLLKDKGSIATEKSYGAYLYNPLSSSKTQELSKYEEETIINDDSQKESEKFYSPFSPNSVDLIKASFKKISPSFKNSPIAIDLKLSNKDILGYNEYSRSAAIMDISIDPVDLGISNRANTIIDGPMRDWINWRKGKLKSLLVDLADIYKKDNPKGKLFILGNVDYYAQQEFNDLRSSQDWISWVETGVVDGVFLRGRWLSRYGDSDRLADYSRRWPTLTKTASHPVMLIPVSGGAEKVANSNYARDWKIVKDRIPSLIQFGLEPESDTGNKDADKFLKGEQLIPVEARPQTGDLFPEFSLTDTKGENWEPEDWVAKKPVALLILPTTSGTKPLVPALDNIGALGEDSKFNTAVISATRLDIPSTSPVILDGGREILDLSGQEPVLAIIDKAGWLRSWSTVKSPDDLKVTSLSSLPTMQLKEGDEAPEFSIKDMNGQLRRLSNLRGKKNLLLTFFPKCFTGRCKNHLVSINERLMDFDAAQTEAWAVSVDPADVQRDFAAMWGFKFPLIPDVGRNLSLLYGAAKTTDQLSDRMSVLIDKTGKIVWIEKNVIVATHGSDVLKKMAELGLAKAN